MVWQRETCLALVFWATRLSASEVQCEEGVHLQHVQSFDTVATESSEHPHSEFVSATEVLAAGGLQLVAETSTVESAEEAASVTEVSADGGLQPSAATGTKDSTEVDSSTEALALGASLSQRKDSDSKVSPVDGAIPVVDSQGGQAPVDQGKVAKDTKIIAESSQSSARSEAGKIAAQGSASAEVAPRLQARSSSVKPQRVPPVDFIDGIKGGMQTLLQGTDKESSLLVQTVQKSMGLGCLTLLCTALLLRAISRFPSPGKLPTGRSLTGKVPTASEVLEPGSFLRGGLVDQR